ncbi:GDP-mannose mannosyl hydrolase [Yersinia nurmii]|uniref:GDP-mannose mannosyl hydrolase n=1 Tax=Yersinia nurmii TaxID=685706 RepID=A0ABM9SIB1_9GAMM|nr:GDP-mannose mannosyl hydrolase [Yersinia nurmii]CNE67280.1 GDP-mannose mannosyl hydrolase [Yersinia nurmii]
MARPLDTSLFKTIVANTPLISIDLVVQDSQNRILLGKRLNRPAKNYWFVPGGRVRKDETLADAFTRLAKEELGFPISIQNAAFIGTFEHFYPDNFSEEDFSTHYVVLGYKLVIETPLVQLPKDQHSQYCWRAVDDLLSADDVHLHTKLYFQDRK